MGAAYLLLERNVAKVYGPIQEKDLVTTMKFFKRQGYKVTAIPEPPSMNTLREWQNNNYGCAVDGCFVDGWSSCPHGQRSWISIFRKELSCNPEKAC